LLFYASLIAGYGLTLAGQWATVYREEALVWTAAHLGDPGRWMLNVVLQGFPPGSFLAVTAVLAGTVLIAVALGAASAPGEAALAARSTGADYGVRAAGALLPFAAAVCLVVVTLMLCRAAEPSNIAVITWVFSLAAGLLACIFIDRRRGTRLRAPYDDRREPIVIAVLASLCLLVVTHDLMGWRWSGTPDESNFFGVAKAMADGTTHRFLLSERGVFEVHPTLSSAYQSLFMMVLGGGGFAWRLSSAAALAASLPALYWLARRLWNARVATIATALFATTPVAVGFAHLGYNNTQVYPVLLGALFLALWACRDDSAAGFYLAGCVAGLGFFTYYPARLTPVLVIWLAWCLGARAASRGGRRRVAVMLLALFLAIGPVAAHPMQTLGRMFQFTVFTAGGQQRAADLASAWELFAATDVAALANQVLLSLVYSVYFVGPHHFQWPPVVDPISGPLVLVGLWLCIAGSRRRTALFLAGTYVLSAALIGGTSHYFRPPLTRLLFLSPFAALLAAVALDRFAAALSAATRSARLGAAVVTVLTIAAVAWGIAWQQYSVRYRYHGYGDGTTAELVRLAVEQPDDMKLIYLQRLDTSMWSVDEILGEYGMKERLQYFRGLENAARDALEQVQPPFMAVLGLGRDHERLAAEAILSRRFPQDEWKSSDPDQYWNLRYFIVER
jgi:hypothetical protein